MSSSSIAILLRSRAGFGGFLLLYTACLFILLPKPSLWLDEILDLQLVRDHHFFSLIQSIPHNGGAVPLGYLSQVAAIRVLGFSALSGRLPSLLFSALACAGMFVLGRQFKLRFPLLGVLLFALSPLQFRYALEARPYSQALALSIWTTIVFLFLLEKLTFPRISFYCLLTLAGLYTQPYAVFVPLTHLTWLLLRSRQYSWPLITAVGLSITLAILGFLPWYLYAKSFWTNSIESSHFAAGIGMKTPLMVMRELAGAGYWGTVLLLWAAGFGLRSRHRRSLLLLYLLEPIFLTMMGDFAFSYFFAIRQLIFVLAPLSVLAALGIENLMQRHFRAATALSFLLITTFTIYNIRFLVRPREDWQAASAILQNLNKLGTCSMFIPEGSLELYRFFVPQISQCQCKGDINALRSVALSFSPYGLDQKSDIRSKIIAAGFAKKAHYNQAGPSIEVYKRP